jgi:DNA-binding response OmpR family regulator
MLAPFGCGEGGTGPAPGGARREETAVSHTLLIADHDEVLCDELCCELVADGYEAVRAASPGALSLGLQNHRPDLLLLGDFDGPSASARLLAALRAGQAPFAGLCAETPAIVLAENGGELALLRAFDAGADDFVVKPARYLELRARVRAVIARAEGERAPAIRRVGALEIDSEGHRAACAGRPLALSRLEFALLAQLGERPSRIHTKAELLRDVWGYQSPGRTRTIDAHACRLRRKLLQAGAGELVINHRGVGYALTAPGGEDDAA